MGSENDNSSGFDVFGEWRTSSSNAVSYGVHLGYGQDGAKYKYSDTFEVDLRDFGVRSSPDIGNVAIDLQVKQGNTLDLLGVIAWNRDGLTPFVMFGYTTVELEAKGGVTGSDFTDIAYNGTVTVKDDVTLKGYKLVAGVEGKFAQNWRWYGALEYADYGDEKINFTVGGLTSED